MFEVIAYRGRSNYFQFQYLDKNGAALAIQSTDTPRFKLGRGNNVTPDLDLSKTATANKSKLTIDDVTLGKVTLGLAQADLASLALGPYDAELSLVDDSETAPDDAIITAERGVVHVVDTLGGAVTL